MTTAYLAPEGFADQLQEELQRAGVAVVQRHERLFICDGQAIAAAWAANIWPGLIKVSPFHPTVTLPWETTVTSATTVAIGARCRRRTWLGVGFGSTGRSTSTGD